MNIGAQIKKRRQILGLSMQDVVDRVVKQGIALSKAAISKYENGKSAPKSTSLRALASALECSPDYLLTESSVKLEWLRFRKKTSLSRRLEAKVKETARQWLEAKFLVQDHISENTPFWELPLISVSTLDDAEETAENLRVRWDIGDWPIESLSAAMEKSGVAVITVDTEEDIDGLSGVANKNLQFVVVASNVPADRMRMNLAHELGHIVITPTEDEKFDEKIAFRFAAALIVPRAVMFERVGRSRQTVSLQELLLIKEEYGISIQALIRRCFDLDIISEWAYRQLNVSMRSRGRHRQAPGDCSHLERPSKFQAHLIRCISEGLIAETEIRTMFPEVAQTIDQLESESRWKWRDLRSLPGADRAKVLQKAAESASGDYAESGSLSDLELIDGDE